VTRFAIAAAYLAAACQGSGAKPALSGSTVTSRDDDAGLTRLYTELQDDILASYDRDEPLEVASGMLDPRVGIARIGVGPGDVYVTGDLSRAPSRWPLELDRATRTEVRSKHLEIQISADQSAAWMADELSWRLELCGRIAAIPLRITALYAHDGDRWIPVFEHLSYGATGEPRDPPAAKPIKTAASSAELETALAAVIDRGVLRAPRDPAVVAPDPTALVLGPGAGDEWDGADVLDAVVPPGKLEDRRVGSVGRAPREPTVAYWVGNYAAEVAGRGGAAATTQRLRATFVFEKRPFATRPDQQLDALACARGGRAARDVECRWVVVQTQLSRPISDDELTQQVFGTALITTAPLALDCADSSSRLRGPRATTTPAAPARRAPPAPSPPAAQTP
jgi:hypothetical protein